METRTFELVFAKFIERHKEQVKEAFFEDACQKREILSDHHQGEKTCQELADTVLEEFSVNVDRKTPSEAVADRFIRFGIRSFRDGLSFADVVRLIILLKRHIWLFFQESNFAGQPFDVRSIVALNNRTVLFFDRAIHYFLVGYEQAMVENASEMDSLYRAFLDKVRRDLLASKEEESTKQE